MGAMFVVVTYLASAALLAFAPGAALLRAAAVVAIGAHAVWTLRFWAWLGFVSLGGPTGPIAIMQTLGRALHRITTRR